MIFHCRVVCCAFFISLIVVSGLGISSCQMNSEPLPDNWRGIVPGKTTEAEALGILGTPLRRIEKRDLLVFEFLSGIEGYPNGVGVQGGIVKVIGIRIDPARPISLSATLAKYHEPEKQTYSTWAQGFHTYIYPRRGLMFIGNPQTDRIASAQYFVQMSIETYMSSWGKDLPLTDPFIK
jgi:hypothetical protein